MNLEPNYIKRLEFRTNKLQILISPMGIDPWFLKFKMKSTKRKKVILLVVGSIVLSLNNGKRIRNVSLLSLIS